MSEEALTLRPCPFCGESSADVDVGETEAVVRCEGCLCEGPMATVGCRDDDDEIDLEAEAVALWNQRKFGVVP